MTGKNDTTITVNLEGKLIDMLIDSGASVNAIDRNTFEKIKTTENVLSKTNAKIYPYGSNVPLKLYGKTNLKIKVGQFVHDVEFQVISGTGKPLIGRKSATELGLLHIGRINSVSPDISSVTYQSTDTILRSFEDRFTGIGKLKDFQLKLHWIRPSNQLHKH